MISIPVAVLSENGRRIVRFAAVPWVVVMLSGLAAAIIAERSLSKLGLGTAERSSAMHNATWLLGGRARNSAIAKALSGVHTASGRSRRRNDADIAAGSRGDSDAERPRGGVEREPHRCAAELRNSGFGREERRSELPWHSRKVAAANRSAIERSESAAGPTRFLPLCSCPSGAIIQRIGSSGTSVGGLFDCRRRGRVFLTTESTENTEAPAR